jgi:Protein of unknown function (DUF2971)
MILYHYTTATGLNGIIRSKSVWASDYRFLNDATEFRYALGVFEQIFASMTSRAAVFSSDVIDLIGRFRQATDEFSVFIAAFSKEPDLLSQWRGYNDGKGYAIGVNGDWLNQNADEQGFRLIPVLYDGGEQRRVVQEKLSLLETMLKERRENQSIFDTVSNWWKHMLFTIAALKNEHFKEEQEYRVVRAGDDWPIDVMTRPSPRGLVPYVAVKLNAKIIDNRVFHANNVGLERVIVGPALPDEQKLAVDALLASQHMRFTIDKSAIPYVAD